MQKTLFSTQEIAEGVLCLTAITVLLWVLRLGLHGKALSHDPAPGGVGGWGGAALGPADQRLAPAFLLLPQKPVTRSFLPVFLLSALLKPRSLQSCPEPPPTS